MININGKILTENGFENGFIQQKNNEQAQIHIGQYNRTISKKYLIVPSLINAHTHIGDSFIRYKDISLPHDIKSLVAPPDGLKHVLLEKTSEDEIIQGMIRGLDELEKEGIFTFLDYRENGYEGIKLLKNALEQSSVKSIILGRPIADIHSSSELRKILQESDGIGLSSVEDYNYEDVRFIADFTKKENKLLSFHVSERIREKIDRVLDFDPDIIVHMTQASNTDLIAVKEKNIPIVVCPRSNHFFRLKANLERMKEVGNQILIGTDNFMFHRPSILQEIKFIQTYFPKLFSVDELFRIITYDARKVLNLKDSIPGSNLPTSWMVIDPNDYQIISILKKVEEG